MQYLSEAHASEQALDPPAPGPDRDDAPGRYRDGLETHLDETRRHAERLEDRLRELGQGNNPLQIGLGRVQTVLGQASR